MSETSPTPVAPSEDDIVLLEASDAEAEDRAMEKQIVKTAILELKLRIETYRKTKKLVTHEQLKQLINETREREKEREELMKVEEKVAEEKLLNMCKDFAAKTTSENKKKIEKLRNDLAACSEQENLLKIENRQLNRELEQTTIEKELLEQIKEEMEKEKVLLNKVIVGLERNEVTYKRDIAEHECHIERLEELVKLYKRKLGRNK